MSTQIELNTDKLRDILKKVQELPGGSGGGGRFGVYTAIVVDVATVCMPDNHAIIPSVANYIGDVTMEEA